MKRFFEVACRRFGQPDESLPQGLFQGRCGSAQLIARSKKMQENSKPAPKR